MDTIFDVGLHKGFDAEFYLKKSFPVVGIEAVPALCSQARERLGQWLDCGQLLIVDRALSDRDDATIDFYINPEKDDWGSTIRGAAEKGMGNASVIKVRTITLATLFDRYGVPYYLKCDIEGGDSLLVRQLLADKRRPRFISIEATDADDFDVLAQCGYGSAQLINQWMHPFVTCPSSGRFRMLLPLAFSR